MLCIYFRKLKLIKRRMIHGGNRSIEKYNIDFPLRVRVGQLLGVSTGKAKVPFHYDLEPVNLSSKTFFYNIQ